MLICIYNKRGMRVAHVWFPNNCSELPEIEADIIFIHGSSVNRQGNPSNLVEDQKTLITDLSTSDIDLKMSRDTRRQIRRAQEDDIKASYYNSAALNKIPELIKEMGDAYETMFKHKNRKVRFNYDLIAAYIKHCVLMISTAGFCGHNIVFHSYIVSKEAVRALHSVSVFRDGQIDPRVAGRANKYLHYQDMLYFKDQGVIYYDWGGISSFEEPTGIDRFKMEFGGERFSYSNIISGQSILGKSAVLIRRIKKEPSRSSLAEPDTKPEVQL